jgi:5-methyltetrahydrofolate--homocysteine methyltransferase
VKVPTFTGPRTLAPYPREGLVPYIDRTPCLQTRGLAGFYPAVLEDPVVGERARTLYAYAQALLHRMVRE